MYLEKYVISRLEAAEKEINQLKALNDDLGEEVEILSDLLSRIGKICRYEKEYNLIAFDYVHRSNELFDKLMNYYGLGEEVDEDDV